MRVKTRVELCFDMYFDLSNIREGDDVTAGMMLMPTHHDDCEEDVIAMIISALRSRQPLYLQPLLCSTHHC